MSDAPRPKLVPIGIGVLVAVVLLMPQGLSGQGTPILGVGGAEDLSSSSLAGAIDSAAERTRQELHIPGLSVAILHGQTLWVAKGYGVADLSTGQRPDAASIYRVGSLTKQFTAAAVMRLAERGDIRLDEPVTTYLPDFLRELPPPTVRQLLNQTAGVADDEKVLEEDVDLGSRPLRRLVRLFAEYPPEFTPGDWWSYSNSNYTLLAALIERVTGRAHATVLREEVIEPAGLGSTGVCHNVPSPPRGVIGYRESASGMVRVQANPDADPVLAGNGDLCSSVSDLAAWMRALADGRVVSSTSFRTMTSSAPVRAGFTPPYGFGLSLRDYDGHRAVSHAGVIDGYCSMVAYFPDDDLIIAVAANLHHTWIQHIVRALLRTVLDLPEPVLKDEPLSDAELERYTGAWNDGLFTSRTYEEGGRLHLEVPELGPPRVLLYQGGGEFATAGPEEFRLRFDDTPGPAQRYVFEWLELNSFARRVSVPRHSSTPGDIVPDRRRR